MLHEPLDCKALQEWWYGPPGSIEFLSTFDFVFPGSSTSSEMAPHLSSEDCGFLLDF